MSLFLFVTIQTYVLANRCEVAEICVTDLSQADCGAGFVVVPNATIFGCCPACRLDDGTGGGEDGNENDPGPTEGCRPPANCLPDGRYAPVQCKGDVFTGRCFCSDENGNRIFGQMWRSEANEMSCACSRKRHELETKHGKLSTLHCTSNGDYEKLQCDEGMCWCVETKTGQPITPPVQEVDMRRLPCFSAASLGEQYLRRCESIVYALATIHREQSAHGTNFLGNPITFCDFDGSYGSYQIQNGIAYCTGRDGKILGSWQVVVSTMQGMNCNCARDTMLYFPERGMTVSEVCQPNGNYRPNQIAGNVTYCVDSDGYQLESKEDWPPECLVGS
ncbi:jg16701 [Pararge aegeria aegeria]|uniref:Jg16701 protein n=2 Tax=Pararge aegeria TaxID=116150 RepID=A0A8S4RM61_9NEOP|nr:jg16701 [Pararge aegeria aegeria]